MTAITITGTAPAAHVPASRGLAHDSWVIARRGLKHMRRQPEALSDATIQPIMFVLLFAYVFGGAIDVPGEGNYREFLMGGIFAQTIVFTAFGVAMSLAHDRKNQAVDRFRALPISRGAVLGGHAVANLFKSCGGKLIGWYLTFGRHDWLVIGEFPDEKSAASAVLAAAAGGSLSDVETTLAMTAKDAAATFEAAGKTARGFRSAGSA